MPLNRRLAALRKDAFDCDLLFPGDRTFIDYNNSVLERKKVFTAEPQNQGLCYNHRQNNFAFYNTLLKQEINNGC